MLVPIGKKPAPGDYKSENINRFLTLLDPSFYIRVINGFKPLSIAAGSIQRHKTIFSLFLIIIFFLYFLAHKHYDYLHLIVFSLNKGSIRADL